MTEQTPPTPGKQQKRTVVDKLEIAGSQGLLLFLPEAPDSF